MELILYTKYDSSRVGDYKLVAGFPGLYDDWYVPGQVATPSLKNWGAVGHNDTNNWELISQMLIKQISETCTPYYLFNLKGRSLVLF